MKSLIFSLFFLFYVSFIEKNPKKIIVPISCVLGVSLFASLVFSLVMKVDFVGVLLLSSESKAANFLIIPFYISIISLIVALVRVRFSGCKTWN